MSRIGRLYIERAVLDHPRAVAIRQRLQGAEEVVCERYGEIFNRRSQNFRLQKRRPALILARKFEGWVLEAPPGYGIGRAKNYYFSHMLNCLYDCRYCFLQGMFRSGHYVLFVNYEDFFDAIDARLQAEPEEPASFFSGYDCDSLALDSLTGFCGTALPFFAAHPEAEVELRTKTANVQALLDREPLDNCVVAFSLTPREAWERWEVGVPSLERRLAAARRLQDEGWPIGLRFDPLIWSPRFEAEHRSLFETAFAELDGGRIHSVSFGSFRLPRPFHRRMERLYPEEPLFAGPLEDDDGVVAFRRDFTRQMLEWCGEELSRYVPPEVLFPCE